jgi:hypothetical protein
LRNRHFNLLDDTIAATPTATFNGTADVPTSDITITFALQTQ